MTVGPKQCGAAGGAGGALQHHPGPPPALPSQTQNFYARRTLRRLSGLRRGWRLGSDGGNYDAQLAGYSSGAEFLSFPSAVGSAPFSYTVQGAAKIWRLSEMQQVPPHAARGSTNPNWALQEKDVVCTFSSHQAALIIR